MEKKAYITPATQATVVAPQLMIALSGGGNASDYLDQDTEGDVKDMGLGSSYNVWDEDWTK